MRIIESTVSMQFEDAEEAGAPVAKDEYLDEVYEAWKPIRPTKVFATYWYFAVTRQEIFFRRLSGEKAPWTADKILARHRFTNAYRASDRVSQYLIRHVLYPEGSDRFTEEDVVFRTLLFKVFNKIETWNLLEEQIGEICWRSYSFERFDAVLSEAMKRRDTIFSAAYIMPSGNRKFGSERKHRNYLRLIEAMMADRLPMKLAKICNLRQGFELLREYPLLGDFLAFQFLIDLNYSELLSFSESSFVVAGPGARDGIHKCFADRAGLGNEEIIRLMAERQKDEFERLGLTFRSLGDRFLQLIDCQNIFCEVDKYARIAHPDVSGLSGRTRIKQVYKPLVATALPDCWYPPKWGINDKIGYVVDKLSA